MKLVKIGLILVLVFFAVFFSHVYSPIFTSWDSHFTPYVVLSIIKHGDTNLDEYAPFLKIEPNMKYSYQYINGHYYSLYPIGTPLLAVPIYFIYKYIAPFLSPKKWFSHYFLQKFIVSFIVALAAVFIFLIAYLSVGNAMISFLLVAIFAFCTSAWSIASRALRYFFLYILWSLFIYVPFLLYTWNINNSFLPAYYVSSNNFGVSRDFGVALAGHLFSPSRGIFIFSPILILSLYGMFLKLSARKIERLDLSLVLIMFMHWLVISYYPDWTGKFSVGNSYFSDMMPYFVFFLIPVIVKITQMKNLKNNCRFCFLGANGCQCYDSLQVCYSIRPGKME